MLPVIYTREKFEEAVDSLLYCFTGAQTAWAERWIADLLEAAHTEALKMNERI